MTNSFEDKLTQMSEKYLAHERETEQAPNKTDELLEQGMSLFDQPKKKKTFAQKAGEFARKAATAPAAMNTALQAFDKAQQTGGTLGAIAGTKWAQKQPEPEESEQTGSGLFYNQPAQQDPVQLQANLRQQWQKLPPELQKAYGQESTYINIKTLEARNQIK